MIWFLPTSVHRAGVVIGNTSRNYYDLDGDVVDALDATGADTHYTYSNRSWVVTITDPMGIVTTNTHDLVGNLTAEQNALSHTATYTLDAVNRQTDVTDPLNHTTATAYWADGQVHTVTDALNNVTSTTYDYVNKQIATTAANGTTLAATTTQFLDAAGNTTSVQATSRTTNTLLDANGQTVASIDSGGNTSLAVFNCAGANSRSQRRRRHGLRQGEISYDIGI